MKKLICILLILGLCLSLAACGGGTKGGTTTPTNAPSGGSTPAPTNAPSGGSSAPTSAPSGGNEQPAEDPMAYTLVMGARDDITNEGKNLMLDTLTWRINGYQASDYLISCEPNADYTEYTLHVTPNITFSDGTPLTAEVIKYSIEALAPSSNLGFKDVLSDIEVVDDQTCVMHFGGKSFLTLEFELSHIFCIKPGAATEEGNIIDWTGTGPFVLVDRQPDTSATLERREDYWNPAKKPEGVKRIIWKVIPDEAARLMALEKKEVDVLGPDSHAGAQISYSALSDIIKEGKLNVDFRESGSPQTLMYNYTNGLMSDIELRKAVTYAIDRQAIIDAATYGIGFPMYTFLPDDAQYAARNGEHFEFDPEISKKILADAGYVDTNGDGIVEKDGQNIVLRYVTRSGESDRTIAILIADSLAQVGLGCEISALEAAASNELVNKGEFDICKCHPWTTAMAYMSWRGGYSDYDNWGPGFGVSDNFPGYLETIQTSIDEEEIYATFDKVWAEVYAAYPAVPLFSAGSHRLYTDEISGLLWHRGNAVNVIDLSEVVINRK